MNLLSAQADNRFERHFVVPPNFLHLLPIKEDGKAELNVPEYSATGLGLWEDAHPLDEAAFEELYR